ncbi:hypothetical protein PM082_007433 [Marasmius tenuissimus]|nr:hypothetical protein PM082_007433 [Marasmius tenuissimus]
MILILGPPSSHELILFATSDHPLVAEKFSAVRQWFFHEGESVSPWVRKWEGRITTLTKCGVEAMRTRHVNHGNKKTKTEEVWFLGWSINKVWRVGQYVQHYTGAEGFVLACGNNKVFFWKGGEEMGATPYVAHRNSLQEVQKTRGVNHILERHRDNVLAEVEKLAGVSQADIFRTASLVEDPNALDPQLMTAEQIDRGLNIVRMGGNPWKFWDVLVWKGKHHGFHHVMDIIPSKKMKSQLMIVLIVLHSRLLLPLHILQQPSLVLQPPADYRHPGIAGLSKQRSQLHLRNAAATPSRATTPSQAMTPTPAVTPPLDPSLVDPAAPEADTWNPNAAPVSNDTTDVSSPPVLAPSSLVDEQWKSTHTSHHEFYEL